MTQPKIMTETEAETVIKGMLDTAVQDCINLLKRMNELAVEYKTDPHETTSAQIQRLATRRARRLDEAKALAIVVAKF